MTYQARKSPCASCPYRRDVEPAIWETSEYAKLPKFDGEIFEQIMAGGDSLFMCHQTGEEICAGWLGHRSEPLDLLAVRVGISRGKVDPAVADFTTDVPLFPSGAEAAAHGITEIENPTPKAVEMIDKIVRKRGL